VPSARLAPPRSRRRRRHLHRPPAGCSLGERIMKKYTKPTLSLNALGPLGSVPPSPFEAQGYAVLGKNPSSRVPGIRFERSSNRMSGIFPAECEARTSPTSTVKTPDIRTARALFGFRGRVRMGWRIELPCLEASLVLSPQGGKGERTESTSPAAKSGRSQ
jgi:hypothetical protein